MERPARGQVMVVTGSEQACEIAPIIDETNPLLPCASTTDGSDRRSTVRPGLLRQARLAEDFAGIVLFEERK